MSPIKIEVESIRLADDDDKQLAALFETFEQESLDNLEKDHDFLLKGDVFTPDLIETWIDYKRKNEVDAIRLRPHPYEFALYYDI